MSLTSYQAAPPRERKIISHRQLCKCKNLPATPKTESRSGVNTGGDLPVKMLSAANRVCFSRQGGFFEL
jgi:hypothetical protein